MFVGVSFDGTALEIDHDAHAFYYGTPSGALPKRVPSAAADLRHFLSELTPRHTTAVVTEERPAPVVSPRLIEALRRSLVRNSDQLQTILSLEWKPYLALPKELDEPGYYPSAESLTLAFCRFTHINGSPDYRRLAQRPEFQNTYEQLREYEKAVTSARPVLQLPAPPKHSQKD